MTDVARAAARAVSRPGKAPRPLWESGYATSLVVLDALLVTLATAVALRLRFGDTGAAAVIQAPTGILGGATYALALGALPPAWVAVLALSRGYESRFLGVGSEEFKRVVSASLRFGALVAVVAYATRVELARAFLLVDVALGLVLLLTGRYLARKALHRLRLSGRCTHRVVVVGSREEVRQLTGQIDRSGHTGLEVVAACLPDDDGAVVEVGGRELPRVGPARELARQLAGVGADTVAIAGRSALSSQELRELAWDLEGTGVDLVVSPALTDVAGPRIRIRPVAGLPLLHVEEPTFTGVRRVVKTSIDLVSAALLLLVLLPVLAAVALLVRLDSPGPVFYRQVRVGRDGRLFLMWKFRTMRVGAEDELLALLQDNEVDGPAFKIRADPRVTRVGAVLRRFSVDELPQLLNVLGGAMSLVGPRPPLPYEVASYADHVHRRLLVKPGITGLWQVSGRSDLPWDEAVRLDLYYVENWSVALDVMILWKTLRVVAGRRGAY